jgi:hypothetical protein
VSANSTVPFKHSGAEVCSLKPRKKDSSDQKEQKQNSDRFAFQNGSSGLKQPETEDKLYFFKHLYVDVREHAHARRQAREAVLCKKPRDTRSHASDRSDSSDESDQSDPPWKA